MGRGLIFDIKEFSVNDGAGVRTTVFFKGCPLRCVWCHNPEGLSPNREAVARQNGCLSCGRCRVPCNHPECQGLGRCLHACPNGLISVAGVEWEADALAKKLLRDQDLFLTSGGGVTLSGGEPLFQAEFAVELLEALAPVNRAVETSGYASPAVFERVLERTDFMMMDLKLADAEEHKRLTGVDNAPILRNFRALKESGKPFFVRVPLIPGLTDTKENLTAISEIVGDAPVELLPYNRMAPAKYSSVGRVFTDLITRSENAPVDVGIFRNARLRAER